MKNKIVAGAILVILIVVFLFGKSCGTPAQPIHAAQVKTVDSAAIVARAALATEKRIKDSMQPVISQLRDTIQLLKKQKKPVDAAMDEHVSKIIALTEAIKTAKDSSATLGDLVSALLDELGNTNIDYQAQKKINNSLIAKLDTLNLKKDSLLAANVQLRATLVATLSVTQDAFHSTVAEDNKPAAQLKIYKVVTKVEALAIAALVLKIALTK